MGRCFIPPDIIAFSHAIRFHFTPFILCASRNMVLRQAQAHASAAVVITLSMICCSMPADAAAAAMPS